MNEQEKKDFEKEHIVIFGYPASECGCCSDLLRRKKNDN